MAAKKSRVGKGIAVAVCGLAIGGGAAAGAYSLMGGKIEIGALSKPEAIETEFVSMGPLEVPLVDTNGDLVAYARIEAALEAKADDVSTVRDKIPVIRHEINVVAWKTAVSTGPEDKLVDVKGVEALIDGAARRTYPANVVRRVVVNSIKPV